jgi:UDP-2,3-diacylglucosamine hydrolase
MALSTQRSFELDAPGSWRAIDFISDLHLSERMPRTFEAWRTHLLATPADAVFMLGDLFEVWVGDDARHGGFARLAVDAMAEAASHRALAVMVGNRDFLLGGAMLRDCGATGLPDPTLLTAWGQRVVLMHGDSLCLADAPYQKMRGLFRSPQWQRDFLAKPLAERLRFAAEVRTQSAARGARSGLDGDGSVDIDAGAAVALLHVLGAAELVHGHTHRPGSNELGPGFKRHVLSDWDLDTAERAEVLRLTRNGFERLAPSRA